MVGASCAEVRRARGSISSSPRGTPWEGGSVTEQNIRLLCESCHRRNRRGVRSWRKRGSAS